jgi:hypothetical protein
MEGGENMPEEPSEKEDAETLRRAAETGKFGKAENEAFQRELDRFEEQQDGRRRTSGNGQNQRHKLPRTEGVAEPGARHLSYGSPPGTAFHRAGH